MNIEILSLDLPENINLKRKFSLFLLDDHCLEPSHFNFIEQDLNDTQVNLVKTILRLGSSVNNKVVTVKELTSFLEDSFKIPAKTTSRNIRDLVMKGIVKRAEVTVNGVPSNSVYCYVFATKSELVENLPVGNRNKTRFTKEHSESFQKALQITGYSADSFNTKSHEISSYPYSRQFLPQEFLSLAPVRRNAINFTEKEFKYGTGRSEIKYKITVKAHDQVPTKAALKTYVALVKLALAYNSKMLSQGIFSEPFEKKEFPCRMSQIVQVKGVIESGPNRKNIDDHLSELQFARYLFSGSPLAQESKHLDGLYSQEEDFIFIAKLRRNNELVKLDGSTTTLPSAYFITLSDQIIENLTRNDKLFVFPERIVNGDPLLLSLYICLRDKKADLEDIELTVLNRLMYLSGTEANLFKQLKTKLDQQYGASQTLIHNDEEFDYNLHGYYLKFCKNSTGKHCLRVVCDLEEMITEAGAYYDPNKGERNAPTIPHPFSPYVDMKREAALDSLEKIIINQFTEPSTVRRVNYRLFNVSENDLLLTYYDSKSSLATIASAFSTHAGFNESDVFDVLVRIQKLLKPIAYGELEVEKRDFESLRSYLKSELGFKVSKLELLEIAKNFRYRKISQWKENDFREIGSFILDKLQTVN